MAGPKFVRANYADLFGSAQLPVLEEMFRWELQQHPSRRGILFNTKSISRDITQASSMHDLPLLQAIAEGQDYSFEATPQGANKTYAPVKYGLGISISEEAQDDGKFDEIADMLRKLAKSARESQEIQAMNVFNNGFSTLTTADGVALFSASHALPSGGTLRNKLSSDSDLSDTSLKQMITDFKTQFVGDSGIKYLMSPRYLVVHPDNYHLAKELIGSELSTAPVQNAAGTDNVSNANNMNSVREYGLQVVESPHLTDADAWFLVSDKGDHRLNIYSRKGIETKAAGNDVGFMNDSLLFKCRYREIVGAPEPIGVFGTPGAG